MRTLAMWAVCAMVTGSVFAQESKPDEAGISKLTSAFATAWGEHDAAAMAALWVPDGDLMNPMGREARGPSQIEQLFRDEHSTYMRGTTLSVKVLRARQLEPGLAVIDCEALLGGVKTPDGKDVLPLKHLIFAVVRKTEAGWRFVTARLSVPVPPPPAS
jgi:uncharacterized protein (TIGR02246 family)